MLNAMKLTEGGGGRQTSRPDLNTNSRDANMPQKTYSITISDTDISIVARKTSTRMPATLHDRCADTRASQVD
jgi:hypothetical protein